MVFYRSWQFPGAHIRPPRRWTTQPVDSLACAIQNSRYPVTIDAEQVMQNDAPKDKDVRVLRPILSGPRINDRRLQIGKMSHVAGG